MQSAWRTHSQIKILSWWIWNGPQHSAQSKKRDYLGGTILPGIRLGMEALRSNTAKLMAVDIEEPTSCLGRTTSESIQAGLFYGQLGGLKEVISEFKQHIFTEEAVTVIGTGGFAQLYKEKSLFDALMPDLVLHGLQCAFEIAYPLLEK